MSNFTDGDAPIPEAFLNQNDQHAIDGPSVFFGGHLNGGVDLIGEPEREAHHDTRIVHDTNLVIDWCHV